VVRGWMQLARFGMSEETGEEELRASEIEERFIAKRDGAEYLHCASRRVRRKRTRRKGDGSLRSE